jgi:hypothetical protein
MHDAWSLFFSFKLFLNQKPNESKISTVIIQLDRLGIEKKWLPSPSEVFVFTPHTLHHLNQTSSTSFVTLPKDDQQDEGTLPTSSSSHTPQKLESIATNVNMKYDPSTNDFPITHPSLIAALNSPSAFYKLYIVYEHSLSLTLVF